MTRNPNTSKDWWAAHPRTMLCIGLHRLRHGSGEGGHAWGYTARELGVQLGRGLVDGMADGNSTLVSVFHGSHS